MRRALACILMLTTCGGWTADNLNEIPAAIVTSGGTRLIGLISSEKPLILRNPSGGQQIVEPGKIRSIAFGPHVDPNLENQALIALEDLRSDQFEVREKAQAKLRGLGIAAFRPLKKAADSTDAEESNRARKLLIEMGMRDGAESGDQIVLADGNTIRGELTTMAVRFRSRWGLLEVPVQLLNSIEYLRADEVKTGYLAPAEKEAVVLKARALPEQAGQADRWEAPAHRLPFGTGAAWTGFRRLTMGTIPEHAKDENIQAGKKMVEVKEGQNLDDAYASWGALLRATGSEKVDAAEVEVPGGKWMAARPGKSDLEIRFIQPGSFEWAAKRGQQGGVGVAGVTIKLLPQGSIGMAAYDRAGRQLTEIFNSGKPSAHELQNGGVGEFELLAIHSVIPIVRVRVFRVGAQRNEDLLIFDTIYDRIVDDMRGAEQACFWLDSGDRLVGKMNGGNAQTLQVQLDLLAEKSAPVELALDQIQRFEPPRMSTDEKPKVEVPFTHGVLLQSGESFRAFLAKLDEKEAVFVFPGGAFLKLPRETLRKVDLHAPSGEPGEPLAAVEVAKDEKPGIDFIKRKNDNSSEKEKEEKKPDVLQTTQSLKAMSNAEVISLDMEARELTIKDADGEWTISPALARTLVFPENAAAKKVTAKFRDWVLALRDGSRFEVSLTAVRPDSITAEMAGGSATLPMNVVEFIERKKK